MDIHGSCSAHAANIAVLADQLAWEAGSELVGAFELATAKAWGNAFCTRCGSGMPWKTRTGRAWIVPAGALDDDPGERPTRNVHYGSRASWHADAAGLPTFDVEP